MIKEFVNLIGILEKKVEPIIKKIEKADPTTKEYGTLLENFSATVQLVSGLNASLTNIAEAAKGKEEKDESNNSQSSIVTRAIK